MVGDPTIHEELSGFQITVKWLLLDGGYACFCPGLRFEVEDEFD